jgi:prophage regulatory protein
VYVEFGFVGNMSLPEQTHTKEAYMLQNCPSSHTAGYANIPDSLRILRLKDVIKKMGISRSTIYDWLNPKSPRYDETFPKQKRLGRQSVGWLESDLNEWLMRP